MNNNFENGLESIRALENIIVGHASIASQPAPIKQIINNVVSCNCKKPINVKIKKLYDDVVVLKQATEGSAGFDLRAYFNKDEPENFILKPHQIAKIGTIFSIISDKEKFYIKLSLNVSFLGFSLSKNFHIRTVLLSFTSLLTINDSQNESSFVLLHQIYIVFQYFW